MARVIAISNQKGGVAKTTTCLSLGACLAELEQTVLMIDLDPQASLTLSMGLNPDKLRRSIGDSMLGNTSLVSVSRETPIFGMDIVPASSGLYLLDKILYERPGFEYRLRDALLDTGLDLYDTVLLDCPPSSGTLALNALTAADLLLIPVQCEFFADHSLRRIVDLVKAVRRRTNPQLTYRVLVTLYDRRNRISRLVLKQMRKALDGTLLNTIIEIDTKLRESPIYSEPITTYAPNSRGAQQYRELARELAAGG
jgi:chromosome partitioning protein